MGQPGDAGINGESGMACSGFLCSWALAGWERLGGQPPAASLLPLVGLLRRRDLGTEE